MRNKSDKRKSSNSAIKVRHFFFCFWLQTQWRKSINHKCHLHFQPLEQSFIFRQTFQYTKLFAWGWDDGIGSRRGSWGEENRIPSSTVDLCFWQRGTSCHKEQSDAAVKVRDAAGKNVRCERESRLWLWAEDLGEGVERHFCSRLARSHV